MSYLAYRVLLVRLFLHSSRLLLLLRWPGPSSTFASTHSTSSKNASLNRRDARSAHRCLKASPPQTLRSAPRVAGSIPPRDPSRPHTTSTRSTPRPTHAFACTRNASWAHYKNQRATSQSDTTVSCKRSKLPRTRTLAHSLAHTRSRVHVSTFSAHCRIPTVISTQNSRV